jgi:arylsulfatase A-like enzyme
MNSFFRLFVLLAPVFAWAAAAAVCAAAPRPNVIVILADDLGYGSLGCYGAPASMIRTPNIDRLAREGRRFTDASSTASVCTPSRYSLLTGCYCWRTSLKRDALTTLAPLLMQPGRLNLASLLHGCGYRTAAIGKWHLGYGTAARVDFTQPLTPGPLDVGFDEHFGVPANHGDITGIYVENDHVSGLRSKTLMPTGAKNRAGGRYLGIDAPQRVDDQVMSVLTGKVTGWIEKQDRARPFFLYYAPVGVHEPITPPSQTAGTSGIGPFGDWIHELDRSVGQVLDTLDRQKLAENTLVIFTSDHGGVFEPRQKRPESDAINAGFKPNGPFRGGKLNVWEGGFRVPLLVRWPGHVPSGTHSDEMQSLVDVLATVASLVGQPLPPPADGAEDSYDMSAAWLGREHSPIRPDMIDHSCDGNFVLREGPWKYIEGKPAPSTPERILRIRKKEFVRALYNLHDDPHEEHDVLAEHPDLANRLQARLDAERDRGFTRPVE